MSEWSKGIADVFRSLKVKQTNQFAVQAQEINSLEEGFLRLRSEVIEQFESKCQDLNSEPDIGNIFVCEFADSTGTITRTDLGFVLYIKFDSAKRTVALKCELPAKFNYVMQVKYRASDHTWYYVNKDRSEVSVEYVVDQALKAIVGAS